MITRINLSKEYAVWGPILSMLSSIPGWYEAGSDTIGILFQLKSILSRAAGLFCLPTAHSVLLFFSVYSIVYMVAIQFYRRDSGSLFDRAMFALSVPVLLIAETRNTIVNTIVRENRGIKRELKPEYARRFYIWKKLFNIVYEDLSYLWYINVSMRRIASHYIKGFNIMNRFRSVLFAVLFSSILSSLMNSGKKDLNFPGQNCNISQNYLKETYTSSSLYPYTKDIINNSIAEKRFCLLKDIRETEITSLDIELKNSITFELIDSIFVLNNLHRYELRVGDTGQLYSDITRELVSIKKRKDFMSGLQLQQCTEEYISHTLETYVLDVLRFQYKMHKLSDFALSMPLNVYDKEGKGCISKYAFQIKMIYFHFLLKAHEVISLDYQEINRVGYHTEILDNLDYYLSLYGEDIPLETFERYNLQINPKNIDQLIKLYDMQLNFYKIVDFLQVFYKYYNTKEESKSMNVLRDIVDFYTALSVYLTSSQFSVEFTEYIHHPLLLEKQDKAKFAMEDDVVFNFD